jgi:preprotein translocase subunit YajC
MNFLVPDAAWAMAPGPAGGGSGGSQLMPTLVMFAAMFAIFYFLMIRPQQRQKAERERMLRAIKRGDRVVTTSGLYGTVTNLSDTTVTLRVADQVKLDFERGAIGRVVEAQSDKDG